METHTLQVRFQKLLQYACLKEHFVSIQIWMKRFIRRLLPKSRPVYLPTCYSKWESHPLFSFSSIFSLDIVCYVTQFLTIKEWSVCRQLSTCWYMDLSPLRYTYPRFYSTRLWMKVISSNVWCWMVDVSRELPNQNNTIKYKFADSNTLVPNQKNLFVLVPSDGSRAFYTLQLSFIHDIQYSLKQGMDLSKILRSICREKLLDHWYYESNLFLLMDEQQQVSVVAKCSSTKQRFLITFPLQQKDKSSMEKSSFSVQCMRPTIAGTCNHFGCPSPLLLVVDEKELFLLNYHCKEEKGRFFVSRWKSSSSAFYTSNLSQCEQKELSFQVKRFWFHQVDKSTLLVIQELDNYCKMRFTFLHTKNLSSILHGRLENKLDWIPLAVPKDFYQDPPQILVSCKFIFLLGFSSERGTRLLLSVYNLQGFKVSEFDLPRMRSKIQTATISRFSETEFDLLILFCNQTLALHRFFVQS